MLLTGHTGFKGSWAALWLARLGAEVTGLALEPPRDGPSLFEMASVRDRLVHRIVDLRDADAVATVVASAQPQIVLHGAAQALVRRAYREPAATFAVNVAGTANLLDALRRERALEAILVITSDKVYHNDECGRAFVETDRLGGHDPYSASKAACELVAASYAASVFDASGVALGTARGGNVIGGGDFSEDRIVPDIWRAHRAGSILPLRNPAATRPWQHVLDCLNGYLLQLEALALRPDAPRALNFGPAPGGTARVSDLAETLFLALRSQSSWIWDGAKAPREMRSLAIDPSLARETLGWEAALDESKTLAWTAQWYCALDADEDVRSVTLQQIEAFEALAAPATAAENDGGKAARHG